MSGKSKKVNPRRQPATKADVEKLVGGGSARVDR